MGFVVLYIHTYKYSAVVISFTDLSYDWHFWLDWMFRMVSSRARFMNNWTGPWDLEHEFDGHDDWVKP